MERVIDIIIPTWNNPDYLNPCVQSILDSHILEDLATLHIVNNGKQDIKGFVGNIPNIVVHEPGENLGWEKGLNYALASSNAPYVVFQNDDTFLPRASLQFYERLLIPFSDPQVAAVSPVTTCASGMQSIFNPATPRALTEASYLIFFTVMLRRSDMEAVGGVDTMAPGGDDLDLSIRLRKAGKSLLVNPHAFIIHHGFKSGIRLRGDSNMKGGWNSIEMQDRTNKYLIDKHGFKTYFDTVQGLKYKPPESYPDLEGDIVRQFVNGEKAVVELGCGARKTVDKAIGVDRVPKGEKIPHVGKESIADVVADVTHPLPFESNSQEVIIARHLLEHCVDSVGAIKNWARVLKPGGKLILAVPDETITRGIPTNFEHVHAFTQESLKSLAEVCGLREVKSIYTQNGVSFVGCYEKVA